MLVAHGNLDHLRTSILCNSVCCLALPCPPVASICRQSTCSTYIDIYIYIDLLQIKYANVQWSIGAGVSHHFLLSHMNAHLTMLLARILPSPAGDMRKHESCCKTCSLKLQETWVHAVQMQQVGPNTDEV